MGSVHSIGDILLLAAKKNDFKNTLKFTTSVMNATC